MSDFIFRRAIWRFLALCWCVPVGSILTVAESLADERPNVILCMGDDHGWDETSFNGHPDLKTPVLDEMAASGLRMNRFYAAHPTCSPTRGSVITGRHPNRYGTFAPNWSIRPEEISIAQILGEAGYACGHFGKWHLGPVRADSPTNPGAMGFDEWLSHDNFFELNPTLSRSGAPPKQFRGESSELIIGETIRFMRNAKDKKKPFFAVVWFGSPHEPYSGLEQDLAAYNKLPEKYSGQCVTLTSNETGLPVKRPLGEVLQERYAEIAAMDRSMGQLRQWLEDEGLRHNTLLWYCGDNGPPVGASVTTPLRGQKGRMYEGGILVPGIIEWPARIPKSLATNVNAVTTDMFPTICDLVGLPLPNRPLDGISLRGLIDGEMTQRPSPICFWGFDTNREVRRQSHPYIDPKLQQGTTPLVKMMNGQHTRTYRNFHHTEISEQDVEGPRVILDNDYKLVIDAGPRGRSSIELFDLKNDQAEEHNLVEIKPDVVKKLAQRLADWQQSVLSSLTGADYR